MIWGNTMFEKKDLSLLENELRKLNETCSALADTHSLKHSLTILINDINHLKDRWDTTTPKRISFSFFDSVSEKLFNQRRLVSEMELLTVCSKTNLLLQGKISINDFNKHAAKFEGQASPLIKLISKVFMAVGILVLLNAFVANTLPLMIITAGIATSNLVAGYALSCKSGETGLTKETHDVVQDYIAYKPT